MVEGKNDPEPIGSRKLTEIKVREVMNKRPRTVRADTSIDGLFERILSQIEACFPVVDKDKRLIGIITESDLFQVLHPRPDAREALKYLARTVGDIMTKRPVSVTPDMTIDEAMNLMAEHRFRRLPVVEGGKLVGLLSLRDIIELHRILR